jgi:UDP-N-acetyl-2-amino-2-deoxyglucuronate dehydrogenase
LSAFGYGIIGCGWVAPAHAWGVEALADEDVTLAAIADRDSGRARALAGRFGVPNVYDDYTGLLARDDVHAVSICLPDHLHREVVLAAAEAGKHVLCEKPLALDAREASEMVAACEQNGVGLGLVMNHRYFPDNVRTKAAILNGELGRIVIGDVVHSSSLTGDPDGVSPWRGRSGKAAGGVLALQAIHFLDLLLWFLGPATTVSAATTTLLRHEQDHEDTAGMTLSMRSGAIATLITTNAAPITDDFTGTTVEVQGTDGYIALEGDRIRTTHQGWEPPPVHLPPTPDGAGEILFGPGHVHEIIDFVRAVRRGDSPPVPGADGHHLISVVTGAYRSAREGRAIEVESGSGAYSDREIDEESFLYQGVGSGSRPRTRAEAV